MSFPAAAGACFFKDDAIMKSCWAPVPKLDPGRSDSIPTPKRGAWNGGFARKAAFDVFQALNQLRSGAEGRALLGSPGSELTVAWSGFEIGLRLSSRGLGDRSFDSHLELEGRPVEYQRGAGPGGEFSRFPASIIRKEQKVPLMHALEKDHSSAGSTSRIHSGESHRLGKRDASALGFFKPALKQAYGVLADHTAFIAATRLSAYYHPLGGRIFYRTEYSWESKP